MSKENIVTRDQVFHMAKLSRLEIPDSEADLFVSQFGDIIEHMNKLRGQDTDGIKPMFSPLENFSITRSDIAERIRTREEILSNAPETDGETFIVPKIV